MDRFQIESPYFCIVPFGRFLLVSIILVIFSQSGLAYSFQASLSSSDIDVLVYGSGPLL